MSDSTPTKTTIFIWPTGLFPRRIIYLLLAKGITLSTLLAHNIHIVPVQITPTGLVSHPDFEARPDGATLPMMRLEYAHSLDNGPQEVWVHESIAIMEYLDELFSTSKGYVELRGSTTLQRARNRDMMSALGDVVVWGMVSMAHSNPATSFWSGLAKEDMSPAAAAHADVKVKALLERMAGWAKNDVLSGRCKSLAGKGVDVTYVDVAFMAQVEYIREMYGLEVIEGHEVLKLWWERMKGEKWVVAKERLGKVEETGKWEELLGQ